LGTNITKAGVWVCSFPEATNILNKENTFFRFKTGIPDFFLKRKMKHLFFSAMQLPRLPQ